MKTIDCTPTWTTVVRILTEILKSPKAGLADKSNATNELLRLAEIVDKQNALNRKKKLD
tara:strand:- start:239 stop:415 length:177 start_codon:yes stop_codon:yes gene_type:complete